MLTNKVKIAVAPHHQADLEVGCVEKGADRPEVGPPLGQPLPDQGLGTAQAHPRLCLLLLVLLVKLAS